MFSLFQGDSGGPLLINSEADDKLEIVGESQFREYFLLI